MQRLLGTGAGGLSLLVGEVAVARRGRRPGQGRNRRHEITGRPASERKVRSVKGK